MSIDLPDFDLSAFLPYRLSVAAQRTSAGLAQHYRDRHGISGPEWRVLVHLSVSGEVSVGDLGTRINLEKSKVSRATTRLADDGLITKTVNEADRRLVSLQLTERGRALMADLLPRAIAYQARLEALLAPHLAALDAALTILTTEEL